MSNSASSLPSILSMVQQKLTFYLLPCCILIGILGNAFCLFYFSRRSQRVSSCALYLFLAAAVNTFALTFGITTNILNAWQSLASTSIIYCKLRMYINHTAIFIARMLIVLASIDTYAMTSTKQICRMFSQRSNARKCAFVVALSCPLIAIHIPIMNTIVAAQCVMLGVYALIFATYQMLIAGIIPPVLMIIFSCLAYFNMKRTGIRQNEIANQAKRRQQRQLVRMVTTQITVYVISAEFVPITTLYRQLTADFTEKSQDQKAVESFIAFIASNILLYLNTWAPFFIYCATSSSFRRAFIRVFKKNYAIEPLNSTVHTIAQPFHRTK